MSLDEFEIRTMTQADAEAIALWHYPSPSRSMTGRPMRTTSPSCSLTLRGDAYFAVDDASGELIGFFGFKRNKPETVDIGLGLHPELTGRGLGGSFLHAGLEYASARFAPKQFTLSVATFNKRAITVYEQAGFSATRVHLHSTNGGEWEFVDMERPAT